MRAAFLAHSARRGDAIGRQIVAKVRVLRGQGWNVRLFVEDLTALAQELKDVTTQHTWATLRHAPIDFAFLREADCCSVEFGSDFALLDALPRLAGTKPRIVFSYYGLTPLDLWESNDRARLEAAYRKCGHVWFADHALANSVYARAELHRLTGYPLDRIHRLPCVIDPPAQHTDPIALRQRIGAEAAVILLFVGRMAVNKRPGLVIEAAGRLTQRQRPVHVVFVGPQGDVFAAETARCRQRAADLRMQDQVHFLGQVSEADLWGWYHAADALLLPSRHEGFGMTAVEAMTCGLPVVAARAAALPETVSAAGLLFAPDSLDDLERQVRRVIAPRMTVSCEPRPTTGAVALVVPRYGTDFAGGAEASLRTMARAFRDSGHAVEVFTTCNQRDSRWANTLAPGTETQDGFPVHRFPIDPYDLDQHVTACEEVRHGQGQVSAEMEQLFLRHSLNSRALLDALSARGDDFATILTGPYLFGLTTETVRRFREKVLLAPCFHDEPTAYLQAFREAYQHVGGLLFHSAAEQRLAEGKLGYQHPNSVVVGTWLPARQAGEAARARARWGPRYLAYCGRYCAEKGLPQVLEYMQRYLTESPDDYRLVCMGQGAMRLPHVPGISDLGFVDEPTKRDVLAGAQALVLLSPNESLSIVLLEAWLQGVPVIVTRRCEVLVDQVERSGGGFVVDSYAEFRRVLDILRNEPERARAVGSAGQAYALRHYADPEAYADRLGQALQQQGMPVTELLRHNGRERAWEFLPDTWEPGLVGLIDKLTKSERVVPRRRVQVRYPLAERQAIVGEPCLISLRLENAGNVPLLAHGPARKFLWSFIANSDGQMVAPPRRTALPGTLLPGQNMPLAVEMCAPAQPGAYWLHVRLGSVQPPAPVAARKKPKMKLVVRSTAQASAHAPGDMFLQAAQAALRLAFEQQRLPRDYVDVTEGALAPLKRFLKSKLLHNFRKAYVDVLSRQQSEVNEALVTALCHLLDGYTVLSQRVQELTASSSQRRRPARPPHRLAPRNRRGQATPQGKDDQP